MESIIIEPKYSFINWICYKFYFTVKNDDVDYKLLMYTRYALLFMYILLFAAVLIEFSLLSIIYLVLVILFTIMSGVTD